SSTICGLSPSRRRCFQLGRWVACCSRDDATRSKGEIQVAAGWAQPIPPPLFIANGYCKGSRTAAFENSWAANRSGVAEVALNRDGAEFVCAVVTVRPRADAPAGAVFPKF